MGFYDTEDWQIIYSREKNDHKQNNAEMNTLNHEPSHIHNWMFLIMTIADIIIDNHEIDNEHLEYGKETVTTATSTDSFSKPFPQGLLLALLVFFY